MMTRKYPGLFLAIEGPDGSGKREQQTAYISRCERSGFRVVTVDFPQYASPIFGKIVGRMLNKEFGELPHPVLASLPYAVDRWTAKPRIEEELVNGGIVIANRYSLSNMAHQSARLPKEQRWEFVNLLEQIEYGKDGFAIPKPDLYIVLGVPSEVCRERISRKLTREYLASGKPMDALEEDLEHQLEAASMYSELARSLDGITLVDCVPGGHELTIQEVHELVWQESMKVLIQNREGIISGERQH